MKKHTIILTALVLCIAFIAPQAWAGSKQRHRWEGAAIGLGAAIVGSTILNHHLNPPRRQRHEPESTVYRHHSPPNRGRHGVRDNRRGRNHRQRQHQRQGHWEVQKVWVSPVWEKVWNPGHYNRRNRWVPGRYINIEKNPGYWMKKRVWVAYR